MTYDRCFYSLLKRCLPSRQGCDIDFISASNCRCNLKSFFSRVYRRQTKSAESVLCALPPPRNVRLRLDWFRAFLMPPVPYISCLPPKKKGEARGVTIIQSVPRWQVNKLVTRHQKISILFIFKVTRVKKFVEVGKRVRWTTVQQLAKKIYLQRKRRHCPVIPLCL